MAKTWGRAPSPCIDVCKFRDAGQCVGCRMTKPEKRAFKRLKGKTARRAFFEALGGRLRAAGRFDYWARMYRRKCARKEAECPLDRMEAPGRLDRAA